MILKKFTDSQRVQQGLSFFMAAFLVGTFSFLGVRYYNSSNALTGASMQLTPASGSYAAGSNVSFTVREDSGSIAVNAVQASLAYNPSHLQFVSITEGGAFPLAAATSTGQPGIIRVGRAIQGATVTGDRPIVTVNFKVLTTGNTTVSIDRSFSSVVRASDSQNVLESVTNGNYALAAAETPATPPAAPTSTAKAFLTLQPNGGTYAKGATIPVTVHVNSTAAKITVVRAVVKYPSNLLEFVDFKDSPTFPTANQLKKVGDTVDFTRGIAGGAVPVTGDNIVITLNFKVIGSAGSLPLTFTGASEVYDNSDAGQNILDLMNSKGTLYGIGATTVPAPPQAPSPAPSSATPPPATSTTAGTSKSIIRAGGALTFTPSKVGSASITADNNTQLSGAVDLAAVANPEILAAHPGDAIVKVAYYLDKKLIATETSPPFTHRFDTKNLKNGSYDMTVKTFYQSGTVDTNTDKLLVKNPVTLSYVLANYSAGIIGSLVTLVVAAVLAWKFLVPRFLGGSSAVPIAGNPITPAAANDSSDWAGIAPDPAVVTPSGAADTSTIIQDYVLAADEQAAAMTQPLDMQNPQVIKSAAPEPVDPISTAAPEVSGVTSTAPDAPAEPSAIPPVTPAESTNTEPDAAAVQTPPAAPRQQPAASRPIAINDISASTTIPVAPTASAVPQVPAPASSQPTVAPQAPVDPSDPERPKL